MKKLVILVLVFLFFLPTVSGNHEPAHQEFELEEGYYYEINIDNGAENDYTILIQSDSKIDAVVLTDAEYASCCSSGETQSIAYTDSRSAVKIDQHSFTVPAGEDGFVLLIDNSDAVENGQSPSGTVQVELTYVENLVFEYKFSVLGFIFGLPLVILITVAGIDLLFMRNDLRKIQIFDQALNYISKFLEQWKHHYWPEDSFVSRYPAVTLLISANIIWFILGLIRGFSASGATIDEALSMGAMWSVGVLQGNLFSLFSANFFHWDWQHLLFNMLGLFFLGPYIEDELGHFGFVSFVMFTGLISSVFSFFNFEAVSGGASGVVFALLGIISGQLIIGKFKKIENFCRFPDMSYFWSMFILNVAIAPFAGAGEVDLFGHGGGFLCGLIFGIYLFNKGRPNTNYFVADESFISKMVNIDDEHIQTIPNYTQLPHGGTYCGIKGKRAYLTPSGHIWFNMEGDEFTLLSWINTNEEE